MDRALATARRCVVTGKDLHGAVQRLNARVCEVGPFLALKPRAFYYRQQPKDAFDILYTALHYAGGTDAARAAFGEEARCGNLACADALQALREMFTRETLPGPAKASYFLHGATVPGEAEEVRYRRATIRQDVVDIAVGLLRAAET